MDLCLLRLVKESHIVIPVLIHDRLYRLRQTAGVRPAIGLRKIERTYQELARVANPYHRQQYLYVPASKINIVYITNMRFSIVLMLPPTYIPLHSVLVVGVKINIYMGRNLFTSGIRVGSS